MLTNKDTWCVNAFHGMSGNNDGTTKLCCMYNSAPGDYAPVLGFDSLSSHFSNPVFEIVRADLDNGVQNPRCNYCWREESAGRKSKRLRDNEQYAGEVLQGLVSLELNLGNTCNLACRTCNPYISSSWMKEAYFFEKSETKITYKEFAGKFKKFHQSYDEDSPFWEELKVALPNIKQFNFYGGEPFMSKKMWELLKIAQETNVSKHIELHYNTNGTHFPIEQMKSWADFKKVNISFSIDGIGDKFEYMRYPAKWNDVNRNMEKFHSIAQQFGNIDLSWCITISPTNIYDVPETLDYFYDNYSAKGFGMYLNLVHGPMHHNIGILPNSIKSVVASRLTSISKNKTAAWDHIPGVIAFMQQTASNTLEFNKFLKVTADSDLYRSQNFKNTFVEYGKLF